MKALRSKILFLVALGAIVSLFLPIQGHITIPAVLHAKDYTSFYPSIPSKVVSIEVKNGQRVKAGDVLFHLSSESLDNQILKSEANLKFYEIIKIRQQASPELSQQNVIIDNLIQEERSNLEGLKIYRAKLLIKAPFDGTIRDIPYDMHPERWVGNQSILGRLVNQENLAVTAYVNSDNIGRITDNAKGVFKADLKYLSDIDIRLDEIAEADTKRINFPELSSLYGGAIPADRSENSVISRRPLYSLNFELNSNDQKLVLTQKGIVVLEVQPISFAGKISKRLVSLFIRETGF